MSSLLREGNFDMNTVQNANLCSFDNQISGHSCILKGTENPQYIYKPYNPAEANFYEIISKKKGLPLSGFIPNYYGVSQLPKSSLEEIASQIMKEDSSMTESEEYANEPTETETEASTVKDQHNSEQNNLSTDSNNGLNDSQSRAEWFKNLFMSRFNGENTKFLTLEDLTSDIEAPCLLDLKMGSIAYNPEKSAHQLSKFSQTTSSSLKFRICGLKVTNPKSETEYFRDKYWGRRLKTDEIHNALALFFYDGHSIRRTLIKQFITQLEELAAAIKTCVGFKFYSVSLLLTYDSSLEDDSFEEDDFPNYTIPKDRLKLKLIDFAKSTYSSEITETDTDLLTGIENLIRCFKYIQENPEIKPLLS